MPKDLYKQRLEKEWNQTHPEEIKALEKERQKEDDSYESHIPSFAQPIPAPPLNQLPQNSPGYGRYPYMPPVPPRQQFLMNMGQTPWGPDIEMYQGTYIEPPPIPDSLIKEYIEKPKDTSKKTEEKIADKTKNDKIKDKNKKIDEEEAEAYISSSVVTVQRTDKRS